MDLELIKLAALRTGLGLNYISKEERITLLLAQLRRELPEGAVLKGGTALNRAYLARKNVNRFSEDLDIDYVSGKKLDARIKRLKSVMKGIRDFSVSKGRLMHRTLRFDCRYVNEFNRKDVVRVEYYLSHSKLLCVREPGEEPLHPTYAATETVTYRVYSLEDLLARKLVACHERMEGKDMYDLFHGLELNYDGKDLGKALSLMLRFRKTGLSVEEFYENLSQKLKASLENPSYIRDSTNHYLPVRLRPDWSELISSLKEKIKSLG